MNTERKELAELFARYLTGTLCDDDTTETWERLSKSTDPTVVNGCQILADQVEDTSFNVEILEKAEWDYVERVRLAILGDAYIVKRSTFHYGWRHLLASFGFIAFLIPAVRFGVGYHLLPLTAILGFLMFAFSQLLPRNPTATPYQSILLPFTSFSGLQRAHKNAEGFKKIRYLKASDNHCSIVDKVFWAFVACCFMAILSPVLLFVLAFPDTEPRYEAITE